ncbi:MAG TPA: AAA family ATPase [Puia sp.]|nr:AAA family ATPase [Puia sp.]
MTLHYIWIDNHPVLSKVGFNLSNRFRIHYKEGDGRVEIREAENHIPVFFAENISNLTALIGENGAGKTTALRYFIEFVSNGIHNRQDNDNVIVYEDTGKFFYLADRELKFDLPVGILSPNRAADSETLRSLATTIFVSNNFDPTSAARNYMSQQLGDTKNLSTWYLLYADYQAKTGLDAFNNSSIAFEQRLSAFAAMEFIRMVRLLKWLNLKEGKGRPFPVKLPAYLNLVLNFGWDKEYASQLDELQMATKDYFSIFGNKNNAFLLNTFLAAVYHFMGEIKFIIGSEQIQPIYLKLPRTILNYIAGRKYEVNSEDSIMSELNSVFRFVLTDMEISLINPRIMEMKIFINQVDSVLNNSQVIISPDDLTMSVSVSEAKEGLETLVEEYFKTPRIAGFADFYFSHEPAGSSALSSGEYGLFVLFARINSIEIEAGKTIFLLIDEAELALHPQWQKEFIYHFVDFINERFKGMQVQVVLTAHSPFILSDMPPNCVILLKKVNGKAMVVESLASRAETFGANIHELYADSFFLQDVLMGNFAKEKIDKIIIALNSENPLEDIGYARSLIGIVGDPIIKTKLLEMLALKTGENTEVARLLAQREYIEKRIREIQSNDPN